jgi:hypothetical protein
MSNWALDSDLQIVNTPTIDWLAQHVQACQSRLLIASPYVNDGILQLTESVDVSLSRTLVTRTDLRDFAIGSSSLDTLCLLARDGFVIRSLSDLHAKIYIFDDSSALVTSANATFSGMNHNWECGLGTHDSTTVTRLARSLMRGLGAERPPRVVPLEELEALHAPLATIKATLPQPSEIPNPAINAPLPDAVFSVTDDETLLQGFRGWRRLTLQGVLAMPLDGFRMEDLLPVCAPLAAQQYPGNHFVAAQLRRQLQILRDRGMVEFIDNRGLYRYTLREREE